jgi:hypothetical protein
MKRVLIASIVLLILSLASARAQNAPASLEQQTVELFQSLSPEQRKEALLPFDSPERHKQVFTPGKRPGIQLKSLSDEQRQKALGLIQSFTSDYGWEKCQAIAKQGEAGGLDKYYLIFFGEPGAHKDYAWRLAEHHLTIVDVEYADGQIRAIGPILLGANPPMLWDDEEDQLIALFGSLSPEDRARVRREGKGISSAPMGKGGAPVGDLSSPAQKQVKAVFEGRLKFFAPAIADRIRKMVQDQGGLECLHIAFWGDAQKRCAQGGKWDFKLGGANFVVDYENSRGHIHMSLSGRAAKS